MLRQVREAWASGNDGARRTKQLLTCTFLNRPSLPQAGAPGSPYVVGVQRVLLADVEPAVGDREVRPARVADVGDRERAPLAVALGAGLDQQHDAVLVAEVDPAVGVHHGRR